MAVRITCISKQGGLHFDPHHAIEKLGWKNEQTGATGQSTREEMYRWIKEDNGKAFVRDSAGDTAFLYPRVSTSGTRFVQTHSDNTWKDNLLFLPECS